MCGCQQSQLNIDFPFSAQHEPPELMVVFNITEHRFYIMVPLFALFIPRLHFERLSAFLFQPPGIDSAWIVLSSGRPRQY